MEKTLFKSEEEFNSFIDENTGLDVPNHGTVRRYCWAEEPKNTLVWPFGVLGITGTAQMSYMESLLI